MTPAARLSAAIELLDAIDAAPRRPADAVANDFFRARRFIGSGDRRAIGLRVWGVLRTWYRLGWWLGEGSGATPRLRVGAALLLDGWSLDGVKQGYSGGQYAPAPLDGAEIARLRPIAGHTLNHPDMPEHIGLDVREWLLPALRVRFGPTLANEARALLEPAPLDLRVNLLKTTRSEAQVALAAEGTATEPTPLSPWGLRCRERMPVTTGSAFKDGLVEIQDEGSQIVALLVGARPGMRVADWCAGAGGKTLALAMAMENRGYIAACDVSAVRLQGAVRRLRRAGAHNVEAHVVSAGDKWRKRHAAGFDRVLVDAPCTGSGTWRRNPDARLRLRPEDLAELVAKQGAILDHAASLVRNGGRLVYATCSLLPSENEDQVAGFLSRHPAFRAVPVVSAWSGAPVGPDARALHLSPATHGTDGFFCAVLERASA